jgi:hypothetical protein
VIPQISETYAQVMVQAIGDANCKAETEYSLGKAERIKIVITPEQGA